MRRARRALCGLIRTATILAASLVPASAATATSAAQTGKIHIVYEKGSDTAWDDFAQSQQANAIMPELATALGDTFRLPKDIVTRFRNCGEANAFYNRVTNEITMCYELIAAVQASSQAVGGTPEEIEADVAGATIFFFLHELGHALVNLLDLPITGREEDAVDDLAALILLAADEPDEGQSESEGFGGMMLASAAIQFGEMAARPEAFENIAFWDEHSLDAQRMYHILCLIYGSNPQLYGELVGEDTLPKARADRCPGEYQQRQRSWERLLDAHVKVEG